MTGILSAAATVTYTSSGYTCLRLARERPAAPILALTPSQATARKLVMSWGAYPEQIETLTNVDQVTEKACEAAVKDGFAQTGDTLVIAAGMPLGAAANTNLVRVATIRASTYEERG